MPSPDKREANVVEFAMLCIGVAMDRLPLEKFLPDFDSYPELDVVRLKWNRRVFESMTSKAG